MEDPSGGSKRELSTYRHTRAGKLPKRRLRISKLGQGTSFFRKKVPFFQSFSNRTFREVEMTGNCISVP